MEEKLTGIKTAYIWGAAAHGENALKYCAGRFNITAFIDKRADFSFNIFCLKPVISPEQFFAKEKTEKNIVIAVRYPAEVIRLIMKSAYNGNIYIFDGRNSAEPLLYEVKNGEICVPEYMDKRFKEWKEYSEHYSKLNPFVLKTYRMAIGWIENFEDSIEICEVGCGSGQFANMLFDQGYTRYTGVDFSNYAIKLAKNANPYYANRFVCEDAFVYLQRYRKIHNTMFIMFEVLEHLNRDLELLDTLAYGSNIIFSVPNFKSFNHIRTFEDLKAIQDRYKMLEILDYLQLPANKEAEKIYHLVMAVKK